MLRIFTVDKLKATRALKNTDVVAVDVGSKSSPAEFQRPKQLDELLRNNAIGEDEYVARYKETMFKRYQRKPYVWRDLVRREGIAFSCETKQGPLCHRHLFREVISWVCEQEGVSYKHCGELT